MAELAKLISPSLLEKVGIDPLKPVGSVIYRAGSFCSIFESNPNIEHDSLYLISRDGRAVGKRGRHDVIRWYWRMSQAEIVRQVLAAERAKRGGMSTQSIEFIDSANLVAGSRLEQIVRSFISN